MPRINVSRVINSAKLRENFTVWRKTGDWDENGRWIQSENPLIFSGVVTAAGTKDIIQVPEGDRISQLMCFHSTQEIFTTHKDSQFSGTSDEIEWRGNRYKVFKVLTWTDFGYFKAIGVSMEGY